MTEINIGACGCCITGNTETVSVLTDVNYTDPVYSINTLSGSGITIVTGVAYTAPSVEIGFDSSSNTQVVTDVSFSGSLGQVSSATSDSIPVVTNATISGTATALGNFVNSAYLALNDNDDSFYDSYDAVTRIAITSINGITSSMSASNAASGNNDDIEVVTNVQCVDGELVVTKKYIRCDSAADTTVRYAKLGTDKSKPTVNLSSGVVGLTKKYYRMTGNVTTTKQGLTANVSGGGVTATTQNIGITKDTAGAVQKTTASIKTVADDDE